MGIRGLSTYVRNNNMFEPYRLHDTPLVIDGLNLVHTLYFKFQRDNRNDHMYGGDYSLWTNCIRNFISILKCCSITPIVIMDGSFDPSLTKFQTTLKRHKASLNLARRIYENNFLNEGICPLLNDYIFTQTLLKMKGVFFYRAIYEADDVIYQVASDLQCPILSNDSDFLVENLPGGVIPIDILLEHFHISTCDETSPSYKYIYCSIYRIRFLKRTFPTVQLELIQICSAILGNDYIDSEASSYLLLKISKLMDVHSKSNRQNLIKSVLNWISRFDSYQLILNNLRKHLHNPEHELIKYIENNFHISNIDGDMEKMKKNDNIEQYFKENYTKLFISKKKITDLPQWMIDSFICGKISNRIFSIRHAHFEWMRPLVEDFTFEQPSYECSYDLCRYIYGLLRTSNKNVPNIKRYARRGTNVVYERVSPYIEIIDIDHNPLPMIDQIDSMSQCDRSKLFFQIMGSNMKKFYDEIDQIIIEENRNDTMIDTSMVDQLKFLLLVFVYYLRNFSHHIWLEFVYALFFNIVLSGNCCTETVPKLFNIDHERKRILNDNLKKLNNTPIITNTKVYMPRVVHLYNCFQACFLNVSFLHDLLNVKSIRNDGTLVLALKGTFIYNLTCDLASRGKPLLHMHELLGRQHFVQLGMFDKLLSALLNYAQRSIVINGILDDDVIPNRYNIQQEDDDGDDDDEDEDVSPNECDDAAAEQTGPFAFVRAFEVSKRKTHMNSQKLKVSKRKPKKGKRYN
ncbi:hypothetical protein RDWZM_009590 [Blomia tropicalis]|uniref:Protein asteroid n=1 Tax=Blomia tropicalis TaxID=40697 RepID=A0A9Q0M1Q1_BLOTA|nr:Protein asteroid 1 [Blomia tropicalis]KAJ6218433.1 hypothetical protein RDWZM_009590 [Blomia tropicalis]